MVFVTIFRSAEIDNSRFGLKSFRKTGLTSSLTSSRSDVTFVSGLHLVSFRINATETNVKVIFGSRVWSIKECRWQKISLDMRFYINVCRIRYFVERRIGLGKNTGHEIPSNRVGGRRTAFVSEAIVSCFASVSFDNHAQVKPRWSCFVCFIA